MIVVVLALALRSDGAPTTAASREELETYFAQPQGLPFDEKTLHEKQADGFHWTEFRYTSLMYDGAPIRVHAVYAQPDSATAQHKAPAILMTHGVFGGAMQD